MPPKYPRKCFFLNPIWGIPHHLKCSLSCHLHSLYKPLKNLPVLVLKARHLHYKWLCLLHWYIIGVPDWALGWLPVGWDWFWKMSLFKIALKVCVLVLVCAQLLENLFHCGGRLCTYYIGTAKAYINHSYLFITNDDIVVRVTCIYI